MCHIYASTDPSFYERTSRSVRIHGHVTSLSLENRFWEILEELAAAEGVSLPVFLTKLHDEVLELKGEITNFASLLRVICTTYLQRQSGAIESAA